MNGASQVEHFFMCVKNARGSLAVTDVGFNCLNPSFSFGQMFVECDCVDCPSHDLTLVMGAVQTRNACTRQRVPVERIGRRLSQDKQKRGITPLQHQAGWLMGGGAGLVPSHPSLRSRRRHLGCNDGTPEERRPCPSPVPRAAVTQRLSA